jgi:hypothetical protein
MSLSNEDLALRADSPDANYRLACAMARLNRPFAVGRIYLERALRGGARRRFLGQITRDYTLLRWRSDPAFVSWLRRIEAAAV